VHHGIDRFFAAERQPVPNCNRVNRRTPISHEATLRNLDTRRPPNRHAVSLYSMRRRIVSVSGAAKSK
jgi:hypothetical protein